MRSIAVFCLLLLLSGRISGQTYPAPAHGLLSHETLTLIRVEAGASEMVVVLELENRIQGGYFCIDRNTFALLPDGSRLKMKRVEGLPYCPDLYRFGRIGERLSFSLYFDRPEELPAWFNVLEECGENCLAVYGISLDIDLSREVEAAYELAERGMTSEAGSSFRKIVEGLEGRGHGLEGSLYSAIITLCLREGDEKAAREWMDRLSASNVRDKDLYIANLAARGIRW